MGVIFYYCSCHRRAVVVQLEIVLNVFVKVLSLSLLNSLFLYSLSCTHRLIFVLQPRQLWLLMSCFPTQCKLLCPSLVVSDLLVLFSLSSFLSQLMISCDFLVTTIPKRTTHVRRATQVTPFPYLYELIY